MTWTKKVIQLWIHLTAWPIIPSKLTWPCFKKVLCDWPIPFHWPNTQPLRSESLKYWSCWEYQVFYFIHQIFYMIIQYKIFYMIIQYISVFKMRHCSCIVESLYSMYSNYSLKECKCIFHWFKYMHIYRI